MRGLRRLTIRRRGAHDEHELARMLAASSLDGAIGSDDRSRFATHLDACRACRQAVIDYAMQSDRVRSLAPLEPPRDLWPALSARLDREEARRADARARLPGRIAASQAHPMRHGSRGGRVLVPGGTGGAFRHPTPITAMATAGLTLALVATLALGVTVIPGLFGRPAATPYAIDPSSVSWVTREADGRYLVLTASVDRACSGDSVSCASFGALPQTLVALDVQPASFFLARSGRDAIVVDAGAAGEGSTVGGAVYAIRLPSPGPLGSGSLPGAASTPEASGAPASGWPDVGPTSGSILESVEPAQPHVTAGAPASAVPAQTADASGPAAIETASVAPIVPGGPSLPAAVASLAGTTPAPTASATFAILEDVILVGGRAAYSPDGSAFAFSARPADGSAGPDVYVWRIGDERARPITRDHASVFSAWVGEAILASGPASDEAAPDAPASPASRPAATAAAESSGSSARTPGAANAAKTHEATSEHATPAVSPSASPSRTKHPRATASAGPSASASVEGVTSEPVSFLLDLRTGTRRDLPIRGLWLPSVDPTGQLIVGWVGSVRSDPATRTWHTADGSYVVGPWADASAGIELPEATDATASQATTAEASAAPTRRPRASVAAEATAPPTARPHRTAVPSPSAEVATASPDHAAPTGLAAPDASGSPLATPAGFRPLNVASLAPAQPADWLVRWDQTGTHLAIWIGDAQTPGVGRLSLVAFDPAGVASPRTLLAGAPALAGFAIGRSRLAWATPPSETGDGSRVRVIIWSGSSVGEAGTAPIRGFETIVDAD